MKKKKEKRKKKMKNFLRFEGEERESKLLGYQINWRR
jgi:hypothetical protein